MSFMLKISLARTFLATVCLAGVFPGFLTAAGDRSPEQRITALENKLLAPCCYSEPVSRHQSEVALRMRLEIARLVQEGKSDNEIIDGYVNQYGQKVIADFAPTPSWAHLVPWLLVPLGSIGLAVWIRRMVRDYKLSQNVQGA